MKFIFYCDSKKGKPKKEQILKAKSNEDLMVVAKIAKCELTKMQILKDLDFSSGKLMCKVDDKKLTMQELWSLLNKKLKISDKVKENKDKSKSKNKKNKKDKSKKSDKNSLKKKKKKDKKSSKKTKNSSITDNKPKLSTASGLIKVTRK